MIRSLLISMIGLGLISSVWAETAANPETNPSAPPTTQSADQKYILQDDNVTKGNEAFANNKLDDAIKSYQTALQANPNNKIALISLARVEIVKGDYKAAAQSLNQYKTKFGEDDLYLREKARLFTFTGKASQAQTIIDNLLQKNPTDDNLLDIKEYLANNTKVSPNENNQASTEVNTQTESTVTTATTTASATTTTQPQNHITPPIRVKKQVSSYNLRVHSPVAQPAIPPVEIPPEIAYQKHLGLYCANPSDARALLELARAANQANHLDASGYYYAIYTNRYPWDKQAWLEYAYVQSWRGDVRGAVWILDNYYDRFGGSDEYWIERARILSDQRPTQSLAIIARLTPRLADNYDVNYASAVAYYSDNQPCPMLQSLSVANQLNPGTNETIGLNAFVLRDYVSKIIFDAYDSFDSDTIKIGRGTVTGQYFVTPSMSLLALLRVERQSASLSSGLNPQEGGHALMLYNPEVGMTYRANRHLNLQATVGGAKASDGEGAMTYAANAFIKFNDVLRTDILVRRNFYDQSPLAISKGIKQNLVDGFLFWQPCLQCFFNVEGSWANFSDGNKMTLEQVVPQIDIVSTYILRITIGADAIWNQFSKRLSNGYYSPLNYKFYSGTAAFNFRQNENVEYQFAMGLGTQKDETFTSWRPTEDFFLQAFIGIYKPWYLVLSAALSTRGQAIGNNPSTDYRIYAFNAILTRRFF